MCFIFPAKMFLPTFCLDCLTLPEPFWHNERSWQSRGGDLAGDQLTSGNRTGRHSTCLGNTYMDLSSIYTEHQLVQRHWVLLLGRVQYPPPQAAFCRDLRHWITAAWWHRGLCAVSGHTWLTAVCPRGDVPSQRLLAAGAQEQLVWFQRRAQTQHGTSTTHHPLPPR